MFREGEQIGPYMLVSKLGKGGFGEVWLAEKRSQFLAKKVAVKLLDGGQVNFETIQREAVLWEAASGHPNVLPIIDADAYDDQVVIVSEYADGGSLSDKLLADGKPPVREAVELTIGILNGLEFLHGKKIIHRDIKPQNILLQGKTPRLADFGISRAMQTGAVSSTIIGTDAYMSPEAFDGKRSVQSDIWSVGVVLYQLLKGSMPFPQDHPSERMFAVLTKEFEPLPDDVPTALREVVQKALAKLPENRFTSAAEMREDLQKAMVNIDHPTYAKTEAFDRSTLPPIADERPDLDSEATVIHENWQDPDATFVRQRLPNVAPSQIATPDSPSLSVLTHVSPPGMTVPVEPVEQERNGSPPENQIFVKILGIGVLIIIGVLGMAYCFGSLNSGSGRLTADPNIYKPSNTSNRTTANADITPMKLSEANAMSANLSPSNMSSPSPSKTPYPGHYTSLNGTTFCEGYHDGWIEGWKGVKGGDSVVPTQPTCPDEKNYKYGGYSGGLVIGQLAAQSKARGK